MEIKERPAHSILGGQSLFSFSHFMGLGRNSEEGRNCSSWSDYDRDGGGGDDKEVDNSGNSHASHQQVPLINPPSSGPCVFTGEPVQAVGRSPVARGLLAVNKGSSTATLWGPGSCPGPCTSTFNHAASST